MCGTPVAPPAAAERARADRPDPETLRCLRAVIPRPATFTFVFIIANVFLYFLMWLSGGAQDQVLLAYGLKCRHELPEGLKRAFGTGMLPTILINLFIGYMARGFIDNAAHLGGLVSGMALALVVGYKRPGARGPVPIAWHALQVACLLLVAASFLM